MPQSDDFGLDEGDTEFIAAATQIEASQNVGFEASPRPTKRRRIRRSHRQLDGASSDELGWSETDEEAHSPAKLSSSTTIQGRTAEDDEPEEDLEYYFQGEIEGQLNQTGKNSKYKIHTRTDGTQYEDQVFTQTQRNLDSSPSHFRGAVWKRPKPLPSPVFNDIRANVNGNVHANHRNGAIGSRQTTLNGMHGYIREDSGMGQDSYQADAALAARLQAEERSAQVNAQNSINPKPPFNNAAPLIMGDELADLPSDAFSSSSPEKSPTKGIITISSQPTDSQLPPRGLRGPQQGLKQMTIFGQPATQDLTASQAATKKHAWPLKSKDEPPTHHKLDEKAMETWVYPTNLGTIRDYQYNIVARSLYHNTLVALPTGLGKTFIAATVMLNYYRWTKDAQIVFMAPTKPLIAQQMEACYQIAGIPRRDTVLMTGETAPGLRAEEWLERRVFFMTPQTVINDLKTGICDPKKIVLVVIDEAHKATGGYAYTEVIKFLRRFNSSFRVHALTATPGSSTDAVQAVVDNMGIARVELRTEQSLDIRPYTHEKHTDTELFDYSDEQALVMDHFAKALRPSVDKLASQNATWCRDPMQLTAYGLTKSRQTWANSDAGRKAAMPVKGMVMATFLVLSKLAHSIGLLKNHGIGPCYSSVREFQKEVESGQMKGKIATGIAQSEDFIKMTNLIRGWTNNPDFIGHPKLEYLREVVLNHFLDAGEGRQGSDVPPSATRVMVFASYRDSTDDICRVLQRNAPMIRPHVFVGQAASKGQEGMDQKRQNAVIQDFKSGKYNTLVATSIGEEGLDIGDVDLIVCYDASSSPVRMLQRIGRTGRKRVGRVVLLLMRGKEENDYARAQDNYAYIQKSIADASKYTYHDDQSPRILPKGVQPVVDKRVVEIPVENTQAIDTNERHRKSRGKGKVKRPAKKFHMPDGVRTGFVKASKMNSDDDDESDEPQVLRKKNPAKKATPSRAKSAPEPKVDPMQLPFLEDVLLSATQQRDLERKYAQTADDAGDLTIRPPDPTRFPAAMTRLGPTKYMVHGRASNVVSTTLQAMHGIDDDRVRTMKQLVDPDELQSFGNARTRLVSPVGEVDDESEELSEIRPTATRKKATPKAKLGKKQAVQRTASIRSAEATDADDSAALPPAKKPRGRPRKNQPIQRTVSMRSAATTDGDDSLPKPPAKKPRGRPRKKQNIRRTTSYGSAAAEGDESSPEPTPANMRIGTQGIDLGSRDTSGEDDDEEPDSELDEFVVRSDQPIEMASSSTRLPDDTQATANVRSCGKKPVGGVAVGKDSPLNHTFDDEDGSDVGLAELASVHGQESSQVEEVPALVAAAPKGRKRRIVVGSDSDE